MRKRNWKEYNKDLIQRGSLTFLIDPKLLNTKPKRTGANGRPQAFSDSLIIMLMMVKIHLKLTYRALEGFMQSLANMQGWSCAIPSYSLICKRSAFLKHALPKLSRSRCSCVLIDASGAKVVGEGEWKVKVHGQQRRRKWVKVHIAVDPKTQEIVAEATTPSSVKDGKMVKVLLKEVKGSIETVIADGAYDGRDVREEIKKHKAKALIPPPRNARLHGIDCERDDAIRIITAFGGDRLAKSIWGKLTGYSVRSLVETAFSRMKRLFGERLFSRTEQRQALENYLRCFILNKMQKIKKFPDASTSANASAAARWRGRRAEAPFTLRRRPADSLNIIYPGREFPDSFAHAIA